MMFLKDISKESLLKPKSKRLIAQVLQSLKVFLGMPPSEQPSPTEATFAERTFQEGISVATGGQVGSSCRGCGGEMLDSMTMSFCLRCLLGLSLRALWEDL